MEKIAVSYFEDLFGATSPTEFESFLEEISPSISQKMNLGWSGWRRRRKWYMLCSCMMHSEKAHGLDGMTTFFSAFMALIKKDLLDMVNNFLNSGKLDIKLNIKNICLIPKTERYTRMTEMRPISLCKVGYKLSQRFYVNS